MKKPPSPTEQKPNTPPSPTKIPTRKEFLYEPEEKEPTLDDKHPRLATLLHIIVMSLLYGGVFFAGALLVVARSGGSYGVPLLVGAIAGGTVFSVQFHRLTKF